LDVVFKSMTPDDIIRMVQQKMQSMVRQPGPTLDNYPSANQEIRVQQPHRMASPNDFLV
jgi:hypothetical protein